MHCGHNNSTDITKVKAIAAQEGRERSWEISVKRPGSGEEILDPQLLGIDVKLGHFDVI